jgi:triphosphatase
MPLARDTETELKFEIAAPALMKLLEHPALSTPNEAICLRSVYFDTADHDLRSAGLSLRVRATGGRFVQTVKTRTSAGMIDRHEWESGVSGEHPDRAALARTPAARVLKGPAGNTLAAVFLTTVRRATHLWRDGDSLVEISIDEGEISAGDEHWPIREVELELKVGDPAALFGLARELGKKTKLRLSLDSKAERGYRLAGHTGTAPIKVERGELIAETPLAGAFRRIVHSCLTQVIGNAQLLPRTRSAETLHQTRIGLRRLRAALSAFRPLVVDDRLNGITAEVKWLAGELDRARDLDVFSDAMINADADQQPDAPLAAFRKQLLSAHNKAYRRAVAAIEGSRFANLLLDITEWVELGSWSGDPAREDLRCITIGAFAGPVLDRLHRRVRKHHRDFVKMEPTERHRLRIAAKKLRYAAEMFSGAFPDHLKRQRSYFAALKGLQDRLGELNDLTVAGELALEIAGHESGAISFAAGIVVGGRRRAEPVLLAAATKTLHQFAGARPFWGRFDFKGAGSSAETLKS